MQNLKKLHKLTYLQNINTDLENKLMVTRGKGWGGRAEIDWEFGIDMYPLLYLK